MDEILASIRRIIESGDGQAAPALSLLPERDATTTNGGAAASASADTRSSAFAASPAAAARVVPLSERLSSSRPGAGAEARWLPVVEPANQPADSEPSEAASAAPAEVEAVSPVEDATMSEPTEAKDRWTQELDDVVTWPVLDRDDAPADLEVKDAAETVLRSTSGEPSAADFGSNAEASSGVSDEGDLPLDFDEADFVEALDRNTSFAQISGETRDSGPSNDFRLPPSSSAPDIFSSPPRTARDDVAFSAVPSASVMQETSALMSRQAGAQVAAAFDDLARAIRDGQMKSMEDMAREMLRPMLQDWLDDNLPRLVERLVREEIERVSRGGRR